MSTTIRRHHVRVVDDYADTVFREYLCENEKFSKLVLDCMGPRLSFWFKKEVENLVTLALALELKEEWNENVGFPVFSNNNLQTFIFFAKQDQNTKTHFSYFKYCSKVSWIFIFIRHCLLYSYCISCKHWYSILVHIKHWNDS